MSMCKQELSIGVAESVPSTLSLGVVNTKGRKQVAYLRWVLETYVALNMPRFYQNTQVAQLRSFFGFFGCFPLFYDFSRFSCFKAQLGVGAQGSGGPGGMGRLGEPAGQFLFR